MSELADLSIVEASALVASGSVSVVELTEAVLKRITETEPFIHAYAYVGAEEALAAARKADSKPRRGPLHGIPFAVKDVLLTHDMPTRANSRVLAGYESWEDAWSVARLREAGAVLVGKHVTHEFATGQDVPPSRNPWGLDRYPGGSSAGSGPSIAVGSSFFALGTDAGGSVRKPASVTGVVGFKPTYGLLSTAGTVRGASVPTLEHIGIFSRSVADAVLVLDVMTGKASAGGAPSMLMDADLRGIRIGIPQLEAFGALPDEAVARVHYAALNVLRELGAEFVDIELPFMDLALPAVTAILTGEMGVAHHDWISQHPERYDDATRRFLELSILSPASILVAGYRARKVLQDLVADVYTQQRLDVIAMPTLPCTAPRLAEMVVQRDMGRLTQFTCPWSLIGHPAISVPSGLTEEGLPVGLQIIGASMNEPVVARVAHGYESRSGWCDRRPPVFMKQPEHSS